MIEEADKRTEALLQRYLAGECSAAELAQVEAWLEEAPARQAYLASLRTLGEAWGRARPHFDSRAAWQKLAPQVAAEPMPQPLNVSHRPGRFGDSWPGSRRRTVVRRWMAAGAIAAAAALGAIAVGLPLQKPAISEVAGREYATASGQQLSVRLSDGTTVRLAPESRITVDSQYGRATRTVRLVGQANFEVAHNAARPFRVIAADMIAWDLGTKFTVRAYPRERFYLAVEEGSVALPEVLQASLLPGDLVMVDSSGRGTVEHGAELGPYTAWLTGTLEFYDTPLPEAVADLARWYGVEVALADDELARRHITVAIHEPTVDGALDLIAPAVGARYQRRGSVVTLSALDIP